MQWSSRHGCRARSGPSGQREWLEIQQLGFLVVEQPTMLSFEQCTHTLLVVFVHFEARRDLLHAVRSIQVRDGKVAERTTVQRFSKGLSFAGQHDGRGHRPKN